MNLLQLAWKNLRNKPLRASLSLILFALGVGLISLLFLLDDQIQKNFEKNLAGVDLVIGSKGSPLQMILSSMYHIDAPTGNITLGEIRPFLNPKHPLIEEALPISMGDSYRGYRIVGATENIIGWYDLQFAKGGLYHHDFDVIIGATVAKTLSLDIGSRFKSSHGLVDDEGLEHDDTDDFYVTGILAPSGTVADQLIITTPQTYWHVHDHHDGPAESEGESNDHDGHDHEVEGDDGHEDHGHAGHDHAGHDHSDHNHANHAPITPQSLLEEDGEKSITSLLIKFKNNSFQTLNMPRSINENTDMQAATPAIEINRLFSMMNDAEEALRILAMVIIIVSGLSIFISLFSSLSDRKYELSIMRVMGGTQKTLFMMIVLEGLLLALIGYVLGILLSHLSMGVISTMLKNDYRYDFNALYLLQKEVWLLPAALALGVLAAVIPAIQASRTDISQTLSKG